MSPLCMLSWKHQRFPPMLRWNQLYKPAIYTYLMYNIYTLTIHKYIYISIFSNLWLSLMRIFVVYTVSCTYKHPSPPIPAAFFTPNLPTEKRVQIFAITFLERIHYVDAPHIYYMENLRNVSYLRLDVVPI